MSNRSSGGGWFWWLLAALVALVAIIYAVSGIGHVLGLTPTGSEVLGGNEGEVARSYEGVFVGYVLTLLAIAAPIAAIVLVRRWRQVRPNDLGRLYGALGTVAVILLLAITLVPAGERPAPHPPRREATLTAHAPKPGSGRDPSPATGADRRARDADRRRHDRDGDREEHARSESRVPGIPGNAKRTTVVSVTDGDTVELAGLGASRVIGVDTPEIYFGEECFGAEASAFARSMLIPGATAYYVHGIERTDDYGRDLVYLWLGGGTFYNAALVKEGYAVTLTIPPNVDYAELFRGLAADAREASRGLWSPATCGGDADAPAEPSPRAKASGSAAGPGAGAGSRCAPGYDPCVPPYPPDVDCDDVGRTVSVTGSDPHGLDADGNGRGCE